MRAMMIDFPEDPEAYDLERAVYVWPVASLVAPVLEEGQTVKEIYLPEGVSGLISSTTLLRRRRHKELLLRCRFHPCLRSQWEHYSPESQ